MSRWTGLSPMMASLPVVGTNIRGTREEIVPEETGLLTPVNDPTALASALNRLVHDTDTRQMMGAAGRQRALALYDEAKVIERQLTLLGLREAI